MNVTFYNIIKRVNSTKQPVGGGTTYTCVLKDRSSIINPTIAVKMPDAVSQTAPAHNYAYIPAYGRYYWVDNWTFEDRQWIASLSVDVLASWKAEIGALSKFVIRTDSGAASNKAGGPDALFPAGFDHLDSAVETAIPGWVDGPASGGSYVVGVIGQDNNLYQCGGAAYGVMSSTSLKNMIQSAFVSREPVISSGWTVTDAIAALIENTVKGVTNPADYIASATWFPFTVSTSGSAVTPYLGFIQATSTVATALASPIYTASVVIPIATIAGQSSTEINFFAEPYTTYYLEFWPFGIFPISGRTLVSQFTQGIQVDIKVDLITGTARFEAYRSNSTSVSATGYQGAYLCGGSATLGVKLPISGGNSNIAAGLGGALSTIGGALDTGSSAFSTAGSFVTGAANSIQAIAPRASSGGSCTGFAGISSKIRLHRTMFLPSGSDYVDEGKVYAKTATISSLSGYVQCWDGEISLGGGTLEERRQISGYLTGGFFYE